MYYIEWLISYFINPSKSWLEKIISLNLMSTSVAIGAIKSVSFHYLWLLGEVCLRVCLIDKRSTQEGGSFRLRWCKLTLFSALWVSVREIRSFAFVCMMHSGAVLGVGNRIWAYLSVTLIKMNQNCSDLELNPIYQNSSFHAAISLHNSASAHAKPW